MHFHINAMEIIAPPDLFFMLQGNLRHIFMQSGHRFHPPSLVNEACALNVGREHRIWEDVDISGFGFRLEIVPLRFHLYYTLSRIKRLGKEKRITATQKHARKGKVRLKTYRNSIWSPSRNGETHRLP